MFLVDSEAHQYEISCYVIKNETTFIQGRKNAKNRKKNDLKRPKTTIYGPTSRF